MRIIKLIKAKPSMLEGDVNRYLKKLQNKFDQNVIVQDIKTMIVTSDVEEACITIDFNESAGLTADMVLTV